MKLFFTGEFKKNYKKLPTSLRKQTEKQLGLLVSDFRHPSLTGLTHFNLAKI